MQNVSRNNAATKLALATLLLAASGAAVAAVDFAFSPNISGGFGNYRWDVSIEGAAVVGNPTLTLLRGHTYSIQANTTAIHPFWIKTAPSIGSANAYSGAELSGNDLTSASSITFTPDANTPDTLYYDCGNHIEMQGVIQVITDPIFADNFGG